MTSKTYITNYSPFGVLLQNRNFTGVGYRYGFNGQERDDEIKGSGNSYDYVNRFYDNRLGRWLSVDPMAYAAPGWSPYRAFYDNPIYWSDPTGLLEWHPEQDGDGNNILVADPGDNMNTLRSYLGTIYGGESNIPQTERNDLSSQVDFLTQNVGSDITGYAIGSENGTFDNLVGKYLVTLSNEKGGSWAYRSGEQGGCSPTLANRVAVATKFVYGENSQEFRRLDVKNIFEGYIGYSLFQNAYVGKPDRINNKKYGPGGIYSYGVTDEMINSSIAGALMYSGIGYKVNSVNDLKPGAIVGFGYHTAIYLSTEYDIKGNQIGIVYWDQSGIHKTSQTGYKFNIGGNFK
jgi:RHS repeat-associated protein